MNIDSNVDLYTSTPADFCTMCAWLRDFQIKKYPTVHSQQSTVNSQQSTVNSQQSTVNNFKRLFLFLGVP
ncbi:hypothetical protein LC612_00160 [Nostoc sp. CHAB 5834]|nr:hypothetical protein [Nostoc sp. CHAB 5834]